MDTMRTQPLFLGHGSPLNVKADNDYTRFLASFSASIGRPAAIVVISAHWVTQGTYITATPHPPQIYDFYGFPRELYEVVYAPPGDSGIAQKIAALVPGIQADPKRGVDHAAWSPLCRLCPDQDIPVLELSLDSRMTFREHYELAGKLKQFRAEGILFIGSGNLVHNLGEISWDDDGTVFSWAARLDRWFAERIAAGDHESFIDAQRLAPEFSRGAPTTEHYLPFLYYLALLEQDEKPATIHESFQNGSLSMRCAGVQGWRAD